MNHPKPNPTPVAQRARPCPLCADMDENFGVIRIWTRTKFNDHVRERHPGLDPATCWAFPMPSQRARG